jgi:hypothetical protein
MSRILISLTIVLTIALLGCGGPKKDKFVGTYIGKQQLTAETMKKMDKAMQTAQDKSMTLNLNEDKSASLSAEGQQQALTGTWSVENDEILITFGAAGGPPMKLKPAADGKSLTLDMGATAASYGTIVFTRS